MPTKAEQAAQIEAASKQIADLQRQLKEAGWTIEGDATRWTQLAMECNAIYGMLDDLFGFKVWSGIGDQDEHKEPLWNVEDKNNGEILVKRCKSLAVAYYEAITKRLAESQESEG